MSKIYLIISLLIVLIIGVQEFNPILQDIWYTFAATFNEPIKSSIMLIGSALLNRDVEIILAIIGIIYIKVK